ncbi:uncharacterized protein C8Q71DRAFT_725822 [Rhodofomes roseus]|uniref:Uncharacterized protein n=1 Tax=Rhodofomes roseus TaxID=34475 RepID=A0ABQ8K7C1_9APHY|nr:uncharacterized protein C8Q71DRAFT_725822 [Rhodofomes roseus]KAH9833143.1 hypothetical protein C8Q71DRAFT_725822 [Rhodofomes roseus]
MGMLLFGAGKVVRAKQGRNAIQDIRKCSRRECNTPGCVGAYPYPYPQGSGTPSAGEEGQVEGMGVRACKYTGAQAIVGWWASEGQANAQLVRMRVKGSCDRAGVHAYLVDWHEWASLAYRGMPFWGVELVCSAQAPVHSRQREPGGCETRKRVAQARSQLHGCMAVDLDTLQGRLGVARPLEKGRDVIRDGDRGVDSWEGTHLRHLLTASPPSLNLAPTHPAVFACAQPCTCGIHLSAVLACWALALPAGGRHASRPVAGWCSLGFVAQSRTGSLRIALFVLLHIECKNGGVCVSKGWAAARCMAGCVNWSSRHRGGGGEDRCKSGETQVVYSMCSGARAMVQFPREFEPMRLTRRWPKPDTNGGTPILSLCDNVMTNDGHHAAPDNVIRVLYSGHWNSSPMDAIKNLQTISTLEQSSALNSDIDYASEEAFILAAL